MSLSLGCVFVVARKSEVHVVGAVRGEMAACRIAVMHVACCMLHACCTLQDAVTPSDNSRWIGCHKSESMYSCSIHPPFPNGL